MAVGRWFLVSALSGFLASAAAAQPTAPLAVWFTWRDPHIAILPDSSGTVLWVQRGAAGSPGPSQTVAVTLDPSKINGWMAGARAFMVQTLTDADTGASRSS